jgi:hypothetical protein
VKKIIKAFIVLLVLSLSIYAATRTWSGGTNTDMNNTANYDGSGSLTNDNLVFDATGAAVASTATASLTCNSIIVRVGYTSAWNDGGQTITTAGAMDSIGSGGAVTVSGKWIRNGDGNITLNAAGALTTTGWDLTHNGSGKIIVKAGQTIDSMFVAANAKIDTISNGITIRRLYYIGTGTLFNPVSITQNISSQKSGYVWTQGTFINNGTIAIGNSGANGPKTSITSYANTGTGTTNFNLAASVTNDTIVLNGACTGMGGANIYSSAGTSPVFHTLTTNGNTMSGNSLSYWGTSGTNAQFKIYAAGSTLNFKGYNIGKAYKTALCSLWTSGTIIDTGNFDLGDSVRLIATTPSLIKMTGTAASNIDLLNQLAYDIEEAQTTAKRLTITNNISCHNFTRTTGTLALNSKNISYSGNFIANSASATDSVLGRIAEDTIKSTGGGLFQLSTSGVVQLDSTVLSLSGGETVNLNANLNIKGLILATAKSFTFQALKLLNPLKYVTFANNDTLRSGSAGNRATINLPAAVALSGLKATDIAIQGGPLYDTSGTGYNGGNDSNVIFDSLLFSSISPNPIAGAGGLCTLTVTHGRTAGGSLTVDGSSTAITSQGAAQWRFTAPAHAVGAVTVAGSNGNGITSGSISLTYQNSNPTSYVWNASAAGQWGVAGNWTPVQVPGALDTAIFDATSAFACSVLTVRRMGRINQVSGTLYFGAQMDTIGAMTIAGTMINAGDTLCIVGNAAVGGTITSTAPTLWKMLGTNSKITGTASLPKTIYLHGGGF